MSKRNIKAKSGKQLYLNQIFYKGMLYTSSEMQEGYCKVIDNFDIAPTGDAASPRKPLKLLDRSSQILNNNSYVYPVKFKQNGTKQSYIKFDRTISEEEFATDTNLDDSFEPSKTVHIINRPENAINQNQDFSFEQKEYIILGKEDSGGGSTDNDSSELNTAYKERVNNYDGFFVDGVLKAFSNTAKIQLTTGASKPGDEIIFDSSIIEVPFEEADTSGEEIHNLYVVDGDTFHYNNTGQNQQIRIFGIDSPEKNYQWYEYAGIFLKNLISGKNLDIKFIEKDAYNRNVSTVKIIDDSAPSFNYDFKAIKRTNTYSYEGYVSVPLDLETLKFYDYNINDISQSSNLQIDLDTMLGSEVNIPSIYLVGEEATNKFQQNDTGFSSKQEIAEEQSFKMFGLDWVFQYGTDTCGKLSFSNDNGLLSITGIQTGSTTGGGSSGSGMIGSQYIPFNINFKTSINKEKVKNIKLFYKSNAPTNAISGILGGEIPAPQITISVQSSDNNYYVSKTALLGTSEINELILDCTTVGDGLGIDNPTITISTTEGGYDGLFGTNSNYIEAGTGFIWLQSINISNERFADTTILASANEGQTIKKISFENQDIINGLSIGQAVSGNSLGLLKTTRKNLSIDVAAASLSSGLSVLTSFILDDQNNPLYPIYIAASNHAQINDYKIFGYSSNDFDPFHYYTTIAPQIILKDSLQITDEMYIEAVRIQDNYQISAKSSTNIDFVKTIYIDYLDAIAFIGRIVQNSSDTNNEAKIIYKGPILFKCNLDSANNTFFNILLPSNEGEGETPNILSAINEGYNLINENVVHIKNDKEQYEVMSPISAAVVALDNIEGTTDYKISDPAIIVSKGVLGQKLLLKAVINEDGYLGYSGISTTDSYGYKLTIDAIQYNGVTLFDATNIIKLPGETTAVHTHTLNLDSARRKLFESIEKSGNYLGSFEPTTEHPHPDVQKGKYYFNESDKFYYKATETSWEKFDISFTDIFNTSPKIVIKSFKIIKPNLDEISLSPTDCNFKLDGEPTVTSFIEHCLFEIKAQVVKVGNDILINIHNNLDAIQMTLNSKNGLIEQQYRTNTEASTVKIYSTWYRSKYSEEKFEAFSPEKLVFIKSSTSNELSKIEDDDWGWESAKGIMPTDYSFVPDSRGTFTFKFSMQPKYSIKLGDNCPSGLADIELINSFQEMYVIIPKLTIGDETEEVSSATLKKNLDIKNATRIDIFNRQICLYGPYTKTNALFFSKFEKYDYFPFPYNVIELDEPITYIYNYKDSLIVFGKYNIYMLSGGTTVSDCVLNKIYENLSIHIPDMQTVITSGNNLIFFNNGVGYVIIPNTYVDSASNIKVYKLTENISNFFYNPEEYIRSRIPKINIESEIVFELSFISYVQNNETHIVCNIEVTEKISNENSKIYNLPVLFIYNQDYKYWKMYSTELFEKIHMCYIGEPNLNNQFIVSNKGNIYIAYFRNTYTTDYKDTSSSSIENYNIVTTINSGYLSVDTMNDKRFKDLIIELDNINPDSNVLVECNFFIDGAPILLSDVDVLVIDKTSGLELPTENVIELLKKYDIYHIGNSPTENNSNEYELISEKYGTAFTIGDNTYSSSGRTHVRIPVFGKGRLPSFTLQIKSDKFYEFINYALIYKEKNINRRS